MDLKLNLYSRKLDINFILRIIMIRNFSSLYTPVCHPNVASLRRLIDSIRGRGKGALGCRVWHIRVYDQGSIPTEVVSSFFRSRGRKLKFSFQPGVVLHVQKKKNFVYMKKCTVRRTGNVFRGWEIATHSHRPAWVNTPFGNWFTHVKCPNLFLPFNFRCVNFWGTVLASLLEVVTGRGSPAGQSG